MTPELRDKSCDRCGADLVTVAKADHDNAHRYEAALRRIASMATFDDPYFIARAALEDAPVNAKGES